MCPTPAALITDPATCASLSDFGMHHIALQLDVNMHARRITGVAELHVRRAPSSSRAPMQLKLDVFHLQIHSVRVQTATSAHMDAEWRVQPFTVFGDALVIELPTTLSDASDFVVTVAYHTDVDSPGVCWLTAEQTAGKKLPFVYTQGQEVLNRSFFPCIDSPSVRITYTAAVTVPAELVCVMSAKRISVTDAPAAVGSNCSNAALAARRQFTFAMQQSIPVYLVAMAVGDLVSADVGPRSSVWTEPSMLEASTREFANVIETYLQAGEALFGAYEWERYDVLVMPPSFPYGGMENPRLTFVSPSLIAGDQSLSSVIAHEIAHSWFGNLVTNASWSDFFLNEGFTMYAERRITEVVHGRALMCLNAKLGEALLREEIASLGDDSPLTRLRVPLDDGIDPGDCYNQCAYEKGYAFVSYLRSLVGSDAAFDAFLRSYCAHFRFQSIAAEHMTQFFVASFPLLADGAELLGPISFATWLHAPGAPHFTSDLSDASAITTCCEALATDWAALASPSTTTLQVPASVVARTADAMTWPVFQLLYFLDCCITAPFASNVSVLCALGDSLALDASHNSEVQFRWCQVLITNTVVAKLDVVDAFLQCQGKQKFQIPIFRLLSTSANSTMRAFATDVYARTRASLHVMVRDRIEALLRVMVPPTATA